MLWSSVGPYSVRVKLSAQRSSWLLPVTLIFVLLKLATWLSSLPITADGDAHSYLPGPSLDVQQGWFMGLEKVSLTGASSMRPWPATLLFGILPTMTLRSGAQMVLSTAAFVVLAAVVASSLRSPLARIIAVAGVFTLGLTPMVTVWEAHLWRESLSVTAGVALLASVFYFSRQHSWLGLAAFVASSLALILLRFTYFPIVIFASLAMTIAYLKSRSQTQSPVRIWALAAATVVVLVYGYTYFSAQDRGWIPWYGQSISEAQFGYIHSGSNPAIEVLMSQLAPDYPECAKDLLPVNAEYPSKHFYFVLDNAENCPEIRSFIQSGEWADRYVEFLVLTPSYVVQVLKNVGPVSLGWAVQLDELSLVPEALASLFVPIGSGWGVFEPLPLWLIAGVVIGVMAFRGTPSSNKAKSGRSARPTLLLISYAVVVSAGLSIALGTLLTPTPDADPYRIGIAAHVLLRLSAVVALVFGLDAFMNRRRMPEESESSQRASLT